jgi:hypothetical protein
MPSNSKRDLSGTQVSRPTAPTGPLNPTGIGSARDPVFKAAANCMHRHAQKDRDALEVAVSASKLDGFLMPFHHLTYLPIAQLPRLSATGFHGRLQIASQANCLRDRKGTAPASGHGSIDGP